MLRCPACGNEDEFDVLEVVRQRSRITTDGPCSYTFIEVVESLDVIAWEELTCLDCGARFHADACGEEVLRDEYLRHHPEEECYAPDVTPEPGPLAQP